MVITSLLNVFQYPLTIIRISTITSHTFLLFVLYAVSGNQNIKMFLYFNSHFACLFCHRFFFQAFRFTATPRIFIDVRSNIQVPSKYILPKLSKTEATKTDNFIHGCYLRIYLVPNII